MDQANGVKVNAFSQLVSTLRLIPGIESSIICDEDNEMTKRLAIMFSSSEMADAKPGAPSVTPAQFITLETRYPYNGHADYVVGFTDENPVTHNKEFKELAYGWFSNIVSAKRAPA